ncbi:MAG: hypothetical protein ACI83H_000302 [Glaciecola sp.]
MTYKTKNEETIMETEKQTEIQVLENGPLLVSGILNIIRPDGSKEIKDKTTAFCRCGASNNKPYCDGEHKKIDFIG